MSPPEVWGPPIWRLFHTLIEKLNPDAYPHLNGQLFKLIVRICKYLPCPECSRDASRFLEKIHLKDYATKTEFKNIFYLFHNWVNAKKRKPLFNYAHIKIYSNYNLPYVINNFIVHYNTRGNMKLLADTFQRSFIVKDLVNWFKLNYGAFKPYVIPNNIPDKQIEDGPKIDDVKKNEIEHATRTDEDK